MKKNISILCAFAICCACHAQDITIRYNNSKAEVTPQNHDSISVVSDGAHVNILNLYNEKTLHVHLSGTSKDGQLILKSDAPVKLTCDRLDLTCQEGAPLWLRNKNEVEIIADEGTDNTLSIAACNDTANHKSAVIWAKGDIKFSGKGTLNVLATGDGCKGIRSKEDITIEDLTINVTTTGNNLGEKENPFGGGFPMGRFGSPDGERPHHDGNRGRHHERNDSTRHRGFGGGFPMGGMGQFNLDNLSEEEKARMEEMRKNFEEMMQNGGGFPMGGFGGDSPIVGFGGGFPMGGFGGAFPEGEEGDGMPFVKRKYKGTAKGIKSNQKVIMNSGTLTVTTSSPGAEGIEGKEGVILNGGNITVTATDDAINANARIELNGAHVMAHSTTNDAIDANLVDFFSGGFGGFFGGGSEQNSNPAIIITGGTVYAWSQRGMPEEGLDCDFSPIEISGGKIFSVGAGMGEMPSVPTQQTAKQLTAVLIGIDIAENQPIQLYDHQGTLIDTITVPFTLKRSSSIITHPQFKIGETYTVKTQNYTKTFTLNENFIIVR